MVVGGIKLGAVAIVIHQKMGQHMVNARVEANLVDDAEALRFGDSIKRPYLRRCVGRRQVMRALLHA